MTAITGTVFIAAGAFWLSFTALADLARRSGIDAGQAWAWPLIVDGIIVVATVAVVALANQSRPTWYPWTLLAAGAVVSVTANAIHAIIAADTDVPAVLAASVAAIPPLVLLSITHLTVILTRPTTTPDTDAIEEVPAETAAPSQAVAVPEAEQAQAVEMPVVSVSERRAEATQLREVEGWSNKQIARHLGVHPSTVGRWFTPAINEEQEETS
ncbi:Phage excisionase |uniref:Phage excisionase \|nr:Phage excisionase \